MFSRVNGRHRYLCLDPKNWYITNPNMGRSVDREIIESEIRKAQRGEGSTLQIVYAKHLNVEIGLRLRRDRWKAADWWEKRCRPELRSLTAFMAACDVIVGGVDGGVGSAHPRPQASGLYRCARYASAQLHTGL